MNLPVTNLPWCTGNNAKTFRLQFLNKGAGGEPPDGTRIVHHGRDELLIQQHTVPDGEISFPVKERTQRS
jgi:hypothetical protein